MLSKGKIIKGILTEVGFVTLFIIALLGLAWLV